MDIASVFNQARAVAVSVAVAAFTAGCAHWPPTPRLERAGAPGYRLSDVTQAGQSDDLLVVLAMSGGGTRAAALGYGVLEELRRTEVTVSGVKRRLLDEVDVISAVSGGTFPAVYYALRGEKTFEEFETKVLSRNFETELVWRILTPTNWFRLPSGTFGKSDLFAELYDETVFDHATFADLKKGKGPLVIINGTDISIGARFCVYARPVRRHLRRSFEGDAGAGRRHLDGACRRCSRPSPSRTVAGPAAMKAPAWQAAAEAAARESGTPGRALLRARALQSYTDPARPFVHVFDGGLSENLGLAEVIRAFEIEKVDPDEMVFPELRRARKIVVIAVNALRFPEVDWDSHAAPPGTDTLTDQMWSIPVDRITLDGVEQVHERLAAWQAGGPGRRAYFAQVTFGNLKDAAERAYFNHVETRLQLPKEQTDKVREVAGRLLREAPAFQRLLADLKSGR